MAKGPYLPNIEEIISAGINPKTGLPVKFGPTAETIKEDLRKVLRVIDLQDAVNRYKWYNLPDGIDGELIERILYYRGQGMFFFLEQDSTFYFLPYALNGGIDCYGRYKEVIPVVFGGTTSGSKNDKPIPFMNGLIKRRPQYSIKLDEIDYSEKLSAIISQNNIKTVTIVRMEVPCCGGLEAAVKTALKNSGKFIPWNVVTVSIDGKIIDS